MQYSCQIAKATYSGRPSLFRIDRATSIGLRSTMMMAKRPWSTRGSHAGNRRLIRGSFRTSGRPAAWEARWPSMACTSGCHSAARLRTGSRPGGRSQAPPAWARKSSFRALTSVRSKNPLGLSSAAANKSASSPAKKPALARNPATALVPLRCMPSMTVPARLGPPGRARFGPARLGPARLGPAT